MKKGFLEKYSLPSLVILLLGIFLLDLSIPRGFNVSLLYLLPLILTFSPSAPSPWLVLSAILPLMFVDVFFRWLIVPFPVFLTNRIIAALVFAAIAFLLQFNRRIARELAAREMVQRSILAASPNSIGIMRDGKLLWVNDTMCRLLGFQLKELVGAGAELIAPWNEERERVHRMIVETVTSSGKGSTETQWRGKDGVVHDILLNWASMGKEYVENEVVFVGVDIHARKKAEEELFSEKQTFETLAQSSPDVIMLLDRFARFRYVNPAMERYTGRPPGYFVGKTITSLPLPKDIKGAWEELFRTALSSGSAARCEMVFPSPAGEKIFVNTYLPVKGRSGRFESVIGFAHDVTEMKRIQAMLEKRAAEAEEGRRTLEALMDNAPEGIVIADAPNARVRMASGFALQRLGLRREDFVGKEEMFLEQLPLFYPDGSRLPPEELPLLQAVTRGKVTSGLELRLKGPSGSIPILVNAVPVRDGGGRVIAGVVIWSDISRMKAAEEVLRRDKETFERLVMERTKELISAQLQLEQARRLSDIGSLAATVAHELRNPLGVIRAASFNIKRRAGKASISGQLENIEKKVSQSDEIINNLLFYSRLKKPVFEHVSLYRILQESIDSFRKRFSDFTLTEDLTRIRGLEIDADPLQLTEVFNNLIGNAHDAVKAKHGRISVAARQSDGDVRLSFQDDGVGMPPEVVKKAFEPFFTTKAKGTGLGLTVVKQVVSLHGGSIDIASEPGKGTTVTVSLPVVQHAAR